MLYEVITVHDEEARELDHEQRVAFGLVIV